ncbi:MAG: hypothetical protein KDA37_10970, partial [Planctomycetales bacterium]|nr:hypothetical protein [Planctomycetales bacterium]
MATILLASISSATIASRVEVVHEFLPFQPGSNPRSPLTSDGDKLYGVGGGPGNVGGIYAIDLAGLGYSEIYTFSGSLLGLNPIGQIIPVGSRLYGVTRFGGANNLGT